MSYFLAINMDRDGWELDPYKTKEELLQRILRGDIFGCEVKILKEIELDLIERGE